MARLSWTLVALAACGCQVEPEPPPPVADPCGDGDPGVICTLVGTGERGANGDDLPALQTHLYLPTSVAFDLDGNLLTDDFNNMKIRRLEADGTLTTIAGTGQHSYALDSSPALESALENPIDIAVDLDGDLFIAELHGARVLKVDPTGWLTAYVGSPVNPGYPGYSGDGGPAQAASLGEGQGLVVGDDGILYIADTSNHVIRLVTPEDEIIDLVAGTVLPAFTDGIGAEAAFDKPEGLAYVDGILYVADSGNNAIRRIDLATREVTTVAGTGAAGFSGDGGPAVDAELSAPAAVAVGPDGELYVADYQNHVIRRIGADGVIDTVVGTPETFGFTGDGVPPLEAQLSRPFDVALSPDGDLVIVDQFNDRVRAVRGFLDL